MRTLHGPAAASQDGAGIQPGAGGLSQEGSARSWPGNGMLARAGFGEHALAGLQAACLAAMDPRLNRDMPRRDKTLADLDQLVASGEVAKTVPRLATVRVQGSKDCDPEENAEAVVFGSMAGPAGHTPAGPSGHGPETGLPEAGQTPAGFGQAPAVSAGLDLAGSAEAGPGGETGQTAAGNPVEALARQLMPWRKGPFVLAGCLVDTEWRSDLKWDRLKGLISPLDGRRVLDVGCGSGYHLWRMVLEGAGLALGIDPFHLSVQQFRFCAALAQCDRALVLPFTLEEWHGLAAGLGLDRFDTVFSMGVLSHRREPLAHLALLRDLLVPGGELVLETLILEGGGSRILNPPGRYAAMSNVHVLPSLEVLSGWLGECGFCQAELLHQGATTVTEQRATAWMTFNSLRDTLDPLRPGLTIEGHPAPFRALLRAKKR